MKKTIKLLSMLVAVVFLCFTMTGCINLRKFYSVEHHLEYISNRIEESYLQPHHTGYEVYPLYNENDEMQYALVEFEPYGFNFVLIKDYADSKENLYIIESSDIRKNWSRYKYEIDDQTGEYEKVFLWDDAGDLFVSDVSYYKSAEIENEKRYLLHFDKKYVPAVKRDDKWLNLVSMELFEYCDGEALLPQASIDSLYFCTAVWHQL